MRARTAAQTTREKCYCIREETNSSSSTPSNTFEDNLLTDSDIAQGNS